MARCGVEQNIKYFDKATENKLYYLSLLERAKKRDPDAVLKLALSWYHGTYTVRDEMKGLYYLEMADMLGADIPSAYYIFMGDERWHGTFFEKDTEKALLYYGKAADKGQEFAYECIGDIYYESDPADYEKAYLCYMTPENKSPDALYKLGEMYRMGLYVEQDVKRALEYYRETINTGYTMDDHYILAEKRLRELEAV